MLSASPQVNQVPIQKQGFSPFADNGGSTLAIAGDEFCLMASDTRQSQGYEINSRYQPHTFVVNEKVVFSGCGMYADCLALFRNIQARQELYFHQHQKQMSIKAVAQMVSIMLYHKRFFPYYVFTVLGGIDEDGHGVVYSFDPVGSYESHVCRAGGASASLIQPFLDNQVTKKNMSQYPFGTSDQAPRPTLQEAMKIAKDAFTSATEREIHTGDYLELFVFENGKKPRVEKVDLKKD